MYLIEKVYVKNWNHMDDSEKQQISITKNGSDFLSEDKISKISNVEVEVAYWRKANAIHKWFVDEVQEGVDDCKEYYVSEEQLKTLLDIVNEILSIEEKEEQKKVAEEKLPTQEGFFFGSTEIDEVYFDDLVSTKEQLEKALEDPDGSFYYSSSW